MMNVSPTTVANVIHGRTSKVSKENVERIQQALKEHNYVQDGAGSSDKRQDQADHCGDPYHKTLHPRPPLVIRSTVRPSVCWRKRYGGPATSMMLYIDRNLDNIFKTALPGTWQDHCCDTVQDQL